MLNVKKKSERKPKTAATGQPALMASMISPEELHERISRRAYQLYEQRDPNGGDQLSDWIRAENEILELIQLERSKNIVTIDSHKEKKAAGVSKAAVSAIKDKSPGKRTARKGKSETSGS
jgi:hypothetical protein